jgi:hypothetical protein
MKKPGLLDPGLKRSGEQDTTPPASSFLLVVAHPLAVIGDVVVPVGPNYVISLAAIDLVSPVAVAHVYVVAPLLGLHVISVITVPLGIDIVVAAPTDNVIIIRGLIERVVFILKERRSLTQTTGTVKDVCPRWCCYSQRCYNHYRQQKF